MMNRRAAAVAVRKASHIDKGNYILWFKDNVVPEIGQGTPGAGWAESGGYLASNLSDASFTLSQPWLFDADHDSFIVSCRALNNSSSPAGVLLNSSSTFNIGFGLSEYAVFFDGKACSDSGLKPNHDLEISIVAAYDSITNKCSAYVNGVYAGQNSVSIAVSGIYSVEEIFLPSMSDANNLRDISIIEINGSLPDDIDAIAQSYHNNPLQKLIQWAN